ncbi:bifunctional folylpolyglutamate synthase/dihydrofolate synthase [Winogradskyella sp. A3E31]|uniref:bifunctional folylpolyglutamate synthase/dihydrofolate synthase n=1 Tax=Winogradskyella sp. A3E31 TaxID=3349637 RepID=UPI00398B9B38
MNYQETVAWMFRQLPMYQNKGKKAFRKDLKNTLLLSNHLNHPELNFKSIHIAGTNGKGSVCHMLASVFQEAGYKTGLYTSPHLKDYRERIKINGVPISKQFVTAFIKRNKSFLEEHTLSFFEMTVGLSFDYFSKKKVDIAIIEVGMGGRLDSTNIINPEVSVITNIGLDHTQFLGDTLEKIAFEKAGIIKHGVPTVIGETQAETTPTFQNISKEKNSTIYWAGETITSNHTTDLMGSYQKKNIKTVLATLNIAKEKGYKISNNHIERGLKNVVKNTGLLGRWQILQELPKVICDTAHNREGLNYTMKQLQQEAYQNLRIVFGVVADKNLNNIIDLLPKNAKYYLCRPNVERGMDVSQLAKVFAEYSFGFKVYSSVSDAYKRALEESSESDIIYIGGSTFVVAEVV